MCTDMLSYDKDFILDSDSISQFKGFFWHKSVGLSYSIINPKGGLEPSTPPLDPPLLL